MANPNATVQYLPNPLPANLTSDWRKFVIHAATPNDTRLEFDQLQRSRVPEYTASTGSIPFSSYPYPNTNGLGYEADISFLSIQSPGFPLWVEKVKVCLHKEATYGCLKVNVFDYGDSLSNVPVNYAGLSHGQAATQNIPVTMFTNNKLISNVLSETDTYMDSTSQVPTFSPFTTSGIGDNIIQANSHLRFGVQYADGNAYGLKVFLVCWALACDKV